MLKIWIMKIKTWVLNSQPISYCLGGYNSGINTQNLDWAYDKKIL